jgi:hypothetical protein
LPATVVALRDLHRNRPSTSPNGSLLPDPVGMSRSPHIMVHAKPGNPFRCGVAGCNRSFTTQQGVLQHKSDVHQKHSGKATGTANPFKCGVCNRSFQSREARAQHVDQSHPSRQSQSRTSFRCEEPNCKRGFHTVTQLDQHTSDAHRKESNVKESQHTGHRLLV